MGGGGGGGGGSYDDTWIRDWTRDAEGREADYVDRFQSGHNEQTGQISDLFVRSDEATRRLNELGSWNQDRINEITGLSNNLSSLSGNVSGLESDFSDLQQAFANQTTGIGDVTGLDEIISNLQSQYSSANTSISDLSNQLSSTESSIRNDITSQLDSAIEGLGINNYLQTSDFEQRMSDNLGALQDTLSGEFAAGIEALNLPAVQQSIADAQGDLSSLTSDFSGLRSDMDWIQQLDLEGFDDRLTAQGTNLQNLITGQGADLRAEFGGDLTDLRNVLESGRGEALANLESQLGRDRAADLLQLRQDVEAGRASEIEALAGNLRQEYGDQLFDLTDTFDQRLSGLQSDIGSDISSLFSQQGDLRGDLEGGLATLTSGLGTTSQQLEALRDSFGDYQTQAASNLGDVRSALEAEIGDLSGSLTSGLSGLQSEFTDRILGTDRAASAARDELRSSLSDQLSQQAATSQQGLASEAAARQEGLASEAAARASGLSEAAAARSELGTALRDEASSALQDVYQTREQALSNLSGQFGENLRAQEASLSSRIDESNRAMEDRIARLGSMMNYRMLGDSAGGVKMRRSKAYKSGAVNTGTGQLSRSMKIQTLNI